MNTIRFTCTSLARTNKTGILVPDKDGYYDQPIGGMSMYNSAGHFYTAEPAALQLFEASSSLQRRIKRGALRGEVDHPLYERGMTDDDYAERMLTIDPRNVCVHWAEIYLDFKNFKNPDGSPIVAIRGKFKPSGCHGDMLQKQIDNGKENVCFSIRAFTMDRMFSGKRHRTLQEIVTFDYVNEPGINIAEKYKSPVLESHVDKLFTQANISRAVDRQILNLGKESVSLSKEELFKSFGWIDNNSKPGFIGW